MSYHSSFKWTFENEVTEELIEEIYNGLEKNRRYNKNSYNHDNYISCYGIFCLMDNIFLNTGEFLDYGDFSEDKIIEYAKGAPDEQKFADILRRVSEKVLRGADVPC